MDIFEVSPRAFRPAATRGRDVCQLARLGRLLVCCLAVFLAQGLPLVSSGCRWQPREHSLSVVEVGKVRELSCEDRIIE
jgi:hypothetical protein